MKLTLLLAAVLAGGGPALAAVSELWGARGEKWGADSRLPDFSFAGYHRGERSIPDVPAAANVKDFGAVGDGVADDTAAIQKAIDATAHGAVFVPAGRYKITGYLRITKSNLVLRGAGAEQTVFWFPRGLDEIHPRPGRTSSGSPASGYSFDGGFVNLTGDYQARPLAKIVAAAARGDRAVQVGDAAGLKAGQLVLIVVQETADHALKTYLYGGDPGDIRRGKPLEAKMVVTVTAVHPDRIEFDRPLRFPTPAAWRPEIRQFAPTVTESGIENLRLEFPPTPYGGHFKETGANAIELRNVYNCWIRNVAVHNADLGVNLVACGNTVDGVTITADPARGRAEAGVAACTGHHAIQCKHAEDNLITRFDLQTSYVHDLSVEHAAGNVFAGGRGVDLNFDHHKDTPYENLFTDVDLGAGGRPWRCGGGASLGRQCAGWGTFWGLRARQAIQPPPAGWGAPTMNFVGLGTAAAAAREPAAPWVEPIGPGELEPRNLHAAQLERRRASLPGQGKAVTEQGAPVRDALLREATQPMKAAWRPMLGYLAELHGRSIFPARAHLPHPYESIGPGYQGGGVFGHIDLTHIRLDTVRAAPGHVRRQIENELAGQQPDGLIPGVVTFNATGQAAWKNFKGFPPFWVVSADAYVERTGDTGFLAQCLAAAEKQLAWFEAKRGLPGGGFYYLDLRENTWESGMDEGIRYDRRPATPAAAVDACAHLYQLYDYASRWAERLGRPAPQLAARAAALRTLIQRELWDERTGFFYDAWVLAAPGPRPLAFEGMWPVVVGAATPAQARRVIDDHLLNPREFFAPHPIATVALNDPRFELRMWRGPSWNCMTYWAARGCARYGHAEGARRLLAAALDSTALQFERTGTIWEFYHPLQGDPATVRRKTSGRNLPSVDYLGHNPLFAMIDLWRAVGGKVE